MHVWKKLQCKSMQMCLMVDYHVPNKMDIDWVYTIFRQTLIRPNLFAWVETEFFMSAEPQKAGFVCSKALQKGLLFLNSTPEYPSYVPLHLLVTSHRPCIISFLKKLGGACCEFLCHQGTIRMPLHMNHWKAVPSSDAQNSAGPNFFSPWYTLAHQWRTQSPLNLWGSAGLPCEDLILLHLI